jgi:FKBP-type peptidyl-prolyl cis-trans isomerase
MKIITQIVALIVLAIGISSCATTTVEDESTAKYAENETQIQAYLTKNNLIAQKTVAGVYYVVTKSNPTGKKVVEGDQMVFHYIESLLDGTKIDSTSVLKNSPAKLPYGVQYNLPAGAVIDAIKELHVGEKAIFLIPSSLAHGSNSVGIIPAYSVLRFDINILALNSEIQLIKSYVSDKKLTVTDTTSTGLRYIRTKQGTGDAVKAGQSVTIKYVAKLLTGTVFDSTGTVTNPSFTFLLGGGSTIKGFDEGVAKMKVGEKATILFPSSIGYGKTGVVNQNTGVTTIPPFSPLSFDIELVGVK